MVRATESPSPAATAAVTPAATEAPAPASSRGLTSSRIEAIQDLGRAFKLTTAALRRLRGRDAHRQGELSHAQYTALFELLARDEVHAGELATLAGVSPASMTEMLDRLAEHGFVERTRSLTDRRVVVCRLTDAGRLLSEERRAQIEPLWERALAGHADHELVTAAAVLDSLRGLFDQLDETGRA